MDTPLSQISTITISFAGNVNTISGFEQGGNGFCLAKHSLTIGPGTSQADVKGMIFQLVPELHESADESKSRTGDRGTHGTAGLSLQAGEWC